MISVSSFVLHATRPKSLLRVALRLVFIPFIPFLIQNCVHAILNYSATLMRCSPFWYPMFHRIHKAAPLGFAEASASPNFSSDCIFSFVLPHEMLRISGATSVSRITIPNRISTDSIWNCNYQSDWYNVNHVNYILNTSYWF